MDSFQHIYGPVPSRRLGRSLGIDLVPFKTCTYDCVYCQLGRTTDKTVERKEYVSVEEVLEELKQKLAGKDIPDYISLAGSGEPTLNTGIGKLIRKIKEMTEIPVAVLTNGSLLWMSEVQDSLMLADLVLPSLDAGDEHLFRYVNRPHEDISFEKMVDGLVTFSRRFSGEIWLEVLLLAGVTGLPSEAGKIAEIIKQIQVSRIQMNTAFRPPAENFATPLSTGQMSTLKDFFPGNVDIVSIKELDDTHIQEFEKDRSADILALLNRRPCTSADVADGLGIHVAEAVKQLKSLLEKGAIKTIITNGRYFYTVNKQVEKNK